MRYSWCHENDSFCVSSLNQHYLSVPQYTGSWGNRFQDTNGSENPVFTRKNQQAMDYFAIGVQNLLIFYVKDTIIFVYSKNIIFIFFCMRKQINLEKWNLLCRHFWFGFALPCGVPPPPILCIAARPLIFYGFP